MLARDIHLPARANGVRDDEERVSINIYKKVAYNGF